MQGMAWDLGVARFSGYDDEGFIGIQAEVLSDGEAMPPFELLHPLGFLARPVDPSQDGTGCTALYAIQGNKAYAWLANDPRSNLKLPNLRPGESIQYGPKSQFIRCHEDGSISLCTFVDGDTDQHSIFLKLDVAKGLHFESPWGRLTFGPDGFHVRHSSGVRIDLGAIAGIPAPLDALASYVTLSAAIASINASAVSQGTDAGLANDTAVTTLVALLGVLAAAIDAKTGATTATVAAVAAASPALSNLGKVV